MLLMLACASAHAQIPAGPYYARGTVFCSNSLAGTGTPPDSCYGYGPDVQLFDDGLHDDGAAGDGVFGGWVTCNQPAGMQLFKIANADWTFGEPTVPAASLINGRVFVSGPGDVVHFLLDTSTPAYGWVPAVSVANDHGYPAGATLELIGSAPELGNWAGGIPVDHVGTLWSKLVVIATPGNYEYKFRVTGTWNFANFGANYNNNVGANGSFATTTPNEATVIQFDERTGRIRAIPESNVAARTGTWGRLKTLYR